MTKVIAIVGLPGAGKSEVVECFVKEGFYKVYFGDVTFDEIKHQNLEINEVNERLIRENIRKKYGMDAYARLSIPKIKKGIRIAGKVVVESMYSFEEYQLLKKTFGNEFKIVAIMASPTLRHERLKNRKIRPLNPQEAESRDIAQIINLNQAGPIAMADFIIINDGTKEEFMNSAINLARKIKQQE